MAFSLTDTQQRMLDGELGAGTQIAMEIIVALAKIYDAKDLVPVSSSQISGVSYGNIGEAGIEFLESLKSGGTRVRAKTTLNPCGLDLAMWAELGFSKEYHAKQARVLDAYHALGIEATCSCIPYLVGNCPGFGEHIAWSESSAVSYINSVVGARTNREGGPSALAAAITGFTGNYGLHLSSNRNPTVVVDVNVPVTSYLDFGKLGLLLGSKIGQGIPLIEGLNGKSCTPENLRQLGASMGASGAVALYHVAHVTPEAARGGEDMLGDLERVPRLVVDSLDVETTLKSHMDCIGTGEPVDLVFFGCPHASMHELDVLLDAFRGNPVKSRVWIATARDIKSRITTDKERLAGIDHNVKMIAPAIQHVPMPRSVKCNMIFSST